MSPGRPGGAELGASDPVHRMTLPGVLAEHRRSRPGTRAVVCGEVRFTYPELDDRTDRLARALRRGRAGAGGTGWCGWARTAIG